MTLFVRTTLIFLLLVQSLSVFAQESLSLRHQTLIWLRGDLEYRINPSWSVTLHIEERRYIFPDRQQQRVFPDVFVTRKFKNGLKTTAGLWAFNIYAPGDPYEQVRFDQREWRPYASIGGTPQAGKGKIKWRIQAEWRIFLEPYASSHFDGPVELNVYRQRFLLGYQWEVGERWSMILAEELHLNPASTDSRAGFFDQNRITLDFVNQVSPAIKTKLGFLHWFQPTVVEKTYFSRYILTTALVLSIPDR